MSGSVARPQYDMGRVLERTFGAIRRNLLSFLLLALILKGVVAGLMGFTRLQMLANQSTTAWVWYVGAIVLYFLMGVILQAAIAHGVFADLTGGRASVGEGLATGARLLPSLIGIGVLVMAAVGGGMIALVVPGIILWLMFSVSAATEVIERRGVIGSMTRSSDLTRNNRWNVFGTLFALGVLGFVIQLAVLGISAGLGGLIPNAPLITAVLVQPIAYSISAVLSAAGLASIYYELRHIKEGVGPEALATVFD